MRATATAVRARVGGTVQGVGFRPFVFRLATELGLGGRVCNDERGVEIEVEGGEAELERFFERLVTDAPPLAAIEGISREAIEPRSERGFKIVASTRAGQAAAAVSPDTATCDDCLAELFDAADRRFRYPFITCTNCGPRFTIVRGIPYDRALTTMAGFEMCAACRREYEDPRDRRFHAEPNACSVCGPQVRLLGVSGDPVAAAAQAILDGAIVAVKGLGGYHLACRADSEPAVSALRDRKHRYDKPFALMVPSVAAAHDLVDLAGDDEELLCSRARPIVLAPRRPDANVARSVAPRSADLGVMLAYSPLHHLLLADAGVPLVMTSGNVSDEPIAFADDDARERLAPIADLFLVHDRPIHTRTDDSVVRATGGGPPLMIRRSRGYVPDSIDLPTEAERPILACGAELKSTFCLAKGCRAWVSHHIGDLQNYETLRSFGDGIEHFTRLFETEPELIVHDLHPDYLSTRYATERDVPRLAVQHHHAHLAACLAEHGRTGPAVGAIYDGTGYGPDGSVWGGELLVGGLDGFERAGHLWPVRMPGGDRAVQEPWRMAAAWLVAATGQTPPPPPTIDVDPGLWRDVCTLAANGLASPATTSAGRLFDAVAALSGVRSHARYEGQAAIELEAICERPDRGYPLPVVDDVLDARATIEAIAADVDAGISASMVSARFHATLAHATAHACARVAERDGHATVVLSGGVFQNRILLSLTRTALEELGLEVLVPERLPPNDGGISYGQAAIGARS